MTALPPVPAPFFYNAWVAEWTDADTVLCRVDRGDRDYSTWPVRLAGIACREVPRPEWGRPGDPGGTEAREEVSRRWPPGHRLVLVTLKPDKFGGRKLAKVIAEGADGEPVDVAAELIRDGWAVPWNGRGAQPKPPWPRP